MALPALHTGMPSPQLLATMCAESATGFVCVDAHGSILFANEAAREWLHPLPHSLADVEAALQQALGWPNLAPGHRAVLERTRSDGSCVALRLTVHAGADGAFGIVLEPRGHAAAASQDSQLLRELTTLLESTTAGIGYVRGGRLARCNQRFLRMLDLSQPAPLGQPLEALFASQPQSRAILADALGALQTVQEFETEVRVQSPVEPHRSGQSLWFGISVRRVGPLSAPEHLEAVVVISNISRLKSQQQRVESLARERELMFNLTGVGLALLKDDVVVQGNQALAHLVGVTVDELPHLELEMLFEDAREPQNSRPAELDGLRRDSTWTGERLLVRKDGRRVWVQVNKRPLLAGSPESGVIASYLNVDARHQAEQALATQAQRTREILNSVLVGIVTVDAHGGIEWLNRSARRMFAGTLPELVGHSLADVATEEGDHPFRRVDYVRTLSPGEARNFECRVKARDGRVFWVVGNVVLTQVPEVGPQLTFALLDIDRRRQAEVALRRVIDLAPMAIALRDASSLRLQSINQVGAQAVGRRREDLIGTRLEEAYPAEVAERVQVTLRRVAAGERVDPQEYTMNLGSGLRTWESRYTLISDPGGASDQVLMVATDVTEQRAAQQARLEAEVSQRDMLVREVHHRIKNNLQGVAGLLQQIAARKPEVGPAISEVVGQVQAIAQVYGLQVGGAAALRIQNVVEAIVASVSRLFGRDIELTPVGAGLGSWILPESESIPVALTLNELLTNAIKHGQGLVAVRLSAREDDVRVEIRNKGQLRPGFDLLAVPSGVSGLGLVRALLPRRSADLDLSQDGEAVVTLLTLRAPGIRHVPTS